MVFYSAISWPHFSLPAICFVFFALSLLVVCFFFGHIRLSFCFQFLFANNVAILCTLINKQLHSP